MKVLYDHQIFTLQDYGGISRYFSELLTYYSTYETIQINLSLKYSNNSYLHDFKCLNHKNLFGNLKFKGKYYVIEHLNRLNTQNELLKSDFDVFHPTYYNPYFLKYIRRGSPYVLTIYDMIHEIYPDYFSKTNKTTKNKKELAIHASKIITISNNTMNDVLKYFDLDRDKIDVIPLATSLNSTMFSEKTTSTNIQLFLPKNYILYVGDRRAQYKNFKIFVKSISSILQEDVNLYLLCVGGGKFTKSEIHIFQSFNIMLKVRQMNVSESELVQCYKNALAFVYPSLYEGFGLPILEAFSCNVPVVLSNSSSFPEVAGDAGLYFDPKSEENIRNSLERVIYDERLRNKLKQKGKKQMEKFSLKLTAEKTKKTYESVL